MHEQDQDAEGARDAGVARDGAVTESGPAAAGLLLRHGREQRGLTVDQCAVALRARAGQVEALERGELDAFGGAVYARGFLRSFATLVQVDPEEVLRLHGEDPAFRGPVLPPREPLRLRRGAPGWLVGLLGVVAVGGVVAVVLGLGGTRVPPAATPSDPAIDAPTDPGGAGADTEDPAPGPAEPDATPEEPVGPPIDLVVTFEEASWLEVLVDDLPADGVPVSGVTVPAGETLRFLGQEHVRLRFGNAGGVRIELNGEDLGAPGRRGEVLELEIRPSGPVEALSGQA